jgi:TRAP transporter TAXI family solute receptor
MIATSVASNGSVANVAAIAAGTAQSGFVQSDIAYWAYNGTGVYSGRPRVEVLRAIANLYPESVQLVVRKGAGIKSVPDLRGRKISLDEPGSGTLVGARLILQAFGLTEKDLLAQYYPAQRVADSLKDGTIDGFFSVSGYPQSAVADLAATIGIELVPITGPEVDKLVAQFPFFSIEEIPDDAYKGVAGVKTVSVHALWVTSSKQPEELIYKVTAALWNPATRKLLDSGHIKGREIRLETATIGLCIPLHPGAEKFYKEKGLLK